MPALSHPARHVVWTVLIGALTPVLMAALGSFIAWATRSQVSGGLTAGFLIGTPAVLGAQIGWLGARAGFVLGRAVADAVAASAVALLTAAVVLREGVICLVLAVPLWLPVVLLAAAGAHALTRRMTPQPDHPGRGVASVGALVAVAALSMATELVRPQDPWLGRVERTVWVPASPERVWAQLNRIEGIQPAEVAQGWAYRIGVPAPIAGVTVVPGVGGYRDSTWQRGVRFREALVAWEPGRELAWRYAFAPDSFPPGSLDDHIVIGGRYFGLEGTRYRLQPENGGTRLSLAVDLRVATTLNVYTVPLAQWLVGDTAQTLLNLYVQRLAATPMR